LVNVFPKSTGIHFTLLYPTALCDRRTNTDHTNPTGQNQLLPTVTLLNFITERPAMNGKVLATAFA
jgi:hypothetical protein